MFNRKAICAFHNNFIKMFKKVKKGVIVFFAAAIVAFAAFNLSIALRGGYNMSDITLANIKALARNESGGSFGGCKQESGSCSTSCDCCGQSYIGSGMGPHYFNSGSLCKCGYDLGKYGK